MRSGMKAGTALFRLYRPIALPFFAILLVIEVIAAAWLASVKTPGFSMWMVLAGSAAKYWLLVVGCVLIALQLRQFVTNGVTRHEFLTGAGVFGLTLVVGWSVAIPLGHAVEAALFSAAGGRAEDYPGIGPLELLNEFGHQVPVTAGWLVSGALFATAFYRWRVATGFAVLAVGAIPAAVAEVLLAFDETGKVADRLPYPAALALSVAATAAGAVFLHRAISEVAIRRTAG